MDACRLANHLAQDVGKLGFRGTICNDEAKWEHAKVGHAPAIWFVFSGAAPSQASALLTLAYYATVANPPPQDI